MFGAADRWPRRVLSRFLGRGRKVQPCASVGRGLRWPARAGAHLPQCRPVASIQPRRRAVNGTGQPLVRPLKRGAHRAARRGRWPRCARVEAWGAAAHCNPHHPRPALGWPAGHGDERSDGRSHGICRRQWIPPARTGVRQNWHIRLGQHAQCRGRKFGGTHKLSCKHCNANNSHLQVLCQPAGKVRPQRGERPGLWLKRQVAIAGSSVHRPYPPVRAGFRESRCALRCLQGCAERAHARRSRGSARTGRWHP
jgi:hypothetical protein